MSEGSRARYCVRMLGLESYQKTLLQVRELDSTREPHKLAEKEGIPLKEATMKCIMALGTEKCYLCKKNITADMLKRMGVEDVKDLFCSGCKQYICEDCDTNYNMPFGSHLPELHAEDPESGEW